MTSFKQFISERIGDAAVEARKLGLTYYGKGEWGKLGTVTHVQKGTSELTPVSPRPAVLTKMDSSSQVNAKISKKDWKKLGQGAQSSVWQKKDQPEQVVKVSGGGWQNFADDQQTDLAYIHFLIDHGKHYPHLPIIIDLDTSHPYVIQIKMEPLKKLPGKIPMLLQSLASAVDGNKIKYTEEAVDDLQDALDEAKDERLAKVNDPWDIVDTIKVLKTSQQKYRKMYSDNKVSKDPGLDLHSGNWLMAADGRIIAADPWYGGE